jgi:hypothetical protein
VRGTDKALTTLLFACTIACGSGGTGSSDDGGAGACPSAQVMCTACDGGSFCAATCPYASCSLAPEGGTEGGVSPCTGTPPPPGQSCSQPQGCTFAGMCAYCAPSVIRAGQTSCAASDQCKWASQSVPPNGPVCPASLPVAGSTCGSAFTCEYCDSDGLFSASCLPEDAGTFMWSVSFTPAQ